VDATERVPQWVVLGAGVANLFSVVAGERISCHWRKSARQGTGNVQVIVFVGGKMYIISALPDSTVGFSGSFPASIPLNLL